MSVKIVINLVRNSSRTVIEIAEISYGELYRAAKTAGLLSREAEFTAADDPATHGAILVGDVRQVGTWELQKEGAV